MTRTLVVGAGLSGLAAAYRLAQAGADVRVLEARSRVGGRAWRIPVGEDAEFDAGCEVLDDAHEALLRLAGELGVPTWRGEPWAGHAEPPLPPSDLALYRALEQEVASLARRIDPLHPEAADDAGALDAQTLGSWLVERAASPRLLAAAETWYSVASAGVPIGDMSLLAFVAKVAAGAAPTGLRLRFEGGPSRLAERLAAALGDRVRLSAEVVAIEQERRAVRVRLTDDRAERAARAVLAMPLTVQSELRFDPPLPQHRRLALERARYGDVVKAALLYDELPAASLPAVTEAGLAYRPYPGLPMLALFAGAGPARRLAELPDELRHREIARVAGGTPRAIASVAWSSERFTQGSYLIFGPGDLTSWGLRLVEPHGRVHFAGSEASPLPSYMDGAVVAGGRAADEVLAAG